MRARRIFEPEKSSLHTRNLEHKRFVWQENNLVFNLSRKNTVLEESDGILKFRVSWLDEINRDKNQTSVPTMKLWDEHSDLHSMSMKLHELQFDSMNVYVSYNYKISIQVSAASAEAVL